MALYMVCVEINGHFTDDMITQSKAGAQKRVADLIKQGKVAWFVEI